MRSSRNGKHIWPVSVRALTPKGFWLELDDRQVFVAFRAFPWFSEFTARELAEVRRPAADHLRWPGFDIDLEVPCVENPRRYPLRERRLRGDPVAVVRRLRRVRARARAGALRVR